MVSAGSRLLTLLCAVTVPLLIPAPAAAASLCATCEVQALDPAFWTLVPRDAQIEQVGAGFRWVEGPVWLADSLLFSDIPANRIYRWRAAVAPEVFLEPSGYDGAAPFTGAEPGSNGLTLDPRGRLVICEHGNRRITRLEADGTRSVLADHYQGRRLNSPNDAVYGPLGDLYFTDPPFGLPATFDDPARELDFSGVFRVTADGDVKLLSRALKAPNGLAFSPDGRFLYVTDVNPARPAWYVFPVDAAGDLGAPRLLRDASVESGAGRGAPDGIKVDQRGNVFGAGPGGVYVMTPEGRLLGMLRLGVPTANVAWGDDGSTLYITASTSVYRIRTGTVGVAPRGPVPAGAAS